MERSKVLDKVKKLLTLASNISVNENEAVNANTEAQKLITRYQIEDAELNALNKKDLEITFARINTESKSDILWRNRLVGYLTEVNNCQFVITKVEREKTLSEVLKNSKDKTYRCTVYTVFGTKDNIELIQILFDLIGNQIEYLSKNKFAGKGKSESNSYKLGVVTTVGQRLRETKQKVIESVTNEQKAIGKVSNALVHIEKEISLVEKFMNDYYKGGLTKAKERKVNLKREAYQGGLKDGSLVKLNNHLALKE